jgi:hypothetical protein
MRSKERKPLEDDCTRATGADSVPSVMLFAPYSA